MELKRITDKHDEPYTALLYCPTGVGKSTAIGLIAEASEGNTLVLDVDRTITSTLQKGEVVKSTNKLFTVQVPTSNTFDEWTQMLVDLGKSDVIKKNNIKTVAVDNISELERCLLSDLGEKGKNKGVPALADYQYMQFKLVNSLRYMKSWGVNVVWTAWEDVRDVTMLDGTKYSQLYPKISAKIVDNICGLCNIVGKIVAKSDGTRGIVLEATQNIYAKNQLDCRKGCLVEDFVKFEFKEKENK